MMTELISLKEAAERLRVSIHTVRAWGYQRKIPLVKLGRRSLLRVEDIEKFINKNVVEAK